jgi:hypothetical protein
MFIDQVFLSFWTSLLFYLVFLLVKLPHAFIMSVLVFTILLVVLYASEMFHSSSQYY